MILPFMCNASFVFLVDRLDFLFFRISQLYYQTNSGICKSLFGQNLAFDASAVCLPVCCWYV